MFNYLVVLTLFTCNMFLYFTKRQIYMVYNHFGVESRFSTDRLSIIGSRGVLPPDPIMYRMSFRDNALDIQKHNSRYFPLQGKRCFPVGEDIYPCRGK